VLQSPTHAIVTAGQRAVVVTGTSSAPVLATAERLARAGHLVMIGARRSVVAELVASRLRAEGATAFAAPLDLSDMSSIDRFVESARYLIGPVDALVCSTGRIRPVSSDNMDNTLGVQHLAAQLIPAMTDNKCGDVVVVGSDHALEAWIRTTSPRTGEATD
jgi:NADP-dependent 3-hydroxy acid dehydrogenase YdfG